MNKVTMNNKFGWVEACSFEEASDFVCKHHYTHSVKGLTPTHCFRVRDTDTDTIVGAAIFGKPAYQGTADCYSEGKRLVELRRFVLVEELGRNAESCLLAVMLRLLRREGIDRVLSYADPNEIREGHPDGRHTGMIYRATGFRRVTKSKNHTAIWYNGRRYPNRNIDQYRQYDGGEPLTPLAIELRAALADGRAERRQEHSKIGYLKDLFDRPLRTNGWEDENFEML